MRFIIFADVHHYFLQLDVINHDSVNVYTFLYLFIGFGEISIEIHIELSVSSS
ncbi:hypothetical protein Xbed_03413 [Xenorhabdus beddingii]|uniref:Uncharacterized protein n=1 Tax=Xenorhabdus beddingii TaxID=40578 RepID=A0A1Y2SDB2_9GAMM|nr:hypothetical protein Xbed_03413 [Xenorhabdus beddingii]